MKAQELLELGQISVKEVIDATKVRYPRADAIALARQRANKIIGARTTLDLKKDQPDDNALAAILLGPTGNLKAPTVLIGKTLIVGFNDKAYRDQLL